MERDAWELLGRKDRVMRDVLDGIAKASQPDVICDVGSFNADEIVRFKGLVPSASCYAFEANLRNINNYIAPRSDVSGILVNNVAVTDYDGEITFNILDAEGEQEDWRRAAGSIIERTDGVGGSKVTVPCTRLDSWFKAQIDENRTFLLWIDVEGALDRVLAGAPQLLRRTVAFRAEVERHEFWSGQTLANEMIAKIEAAGFIVLGDSFTSDAFAQSDILCVNKRWLDLAVRDEQSGM